MEEGSGKKLAPRGNLNACTFRFFRRSKLIVDAATGWPPAPWGTSPVGSPLRNAGAPLRYGGLRANPAVASLNRPPKNPNRSGEIPKWSLRFLPLAQADRRGISFIWRKYQIR